MEKKKVLIITAMDPYKDIRAIKTAKTLVNQGCDVCIVAGFTENTFKQTSFDFNVKAYDKPYNIKASVVWKLIWKIRFFIFTFKFILKQKADVLHACNIDMLVLAYMVSKLQKTKLIYDSYEICAHKSGVTSDSKLMSRLIEKIENFLVKKIDYMICVSKSALKYFQELYKVEKIETITNVPFGINTSTLFKKKKSRIKKVLYLGNFSPHRGIEELILSARNINENALIHLQGFGPFQDDFNTIIKTNNLEKKVEFIDPVEPAKVITEIAKNADIGVVLTKATSINHQLTVSNKIFDYINAGIPVIMSSVSEHHYLNEKYNIGIIVEDVKPETIAEAINILVTDDALYNKLSNNCIKAAKILNWGLEQKKLVNVYKEIFQ